MNPMTNIKNLQKLNERELELGIIGKKSWHDEYKDSAWIFVGGLPYDLSEGDIVCVFSQYGEVVNFNLVRDQKTGKSKGFCFVCFEDQRSTVLSVDNLNGIKVLGRTIRVDHVKDYKVPKEFGDEDVLTLKVRSEGCAPKIKSSSESSSEEEEPVVKKKKEKKVKKEKKKNHNKAVKSEPGSSDKDAQGIRMIPKREIKQEGDSDDNPAHRSTYTSSSQDDVGRQTRHDERQDFKRFSNGENRRNQSGDRQRIDERGASYDGRSDDRSKHSGYDGYGEQRGESSREYDDRKKKHYNDEDRRRDRDSGKGSGDFRRYDDDRRGFKGKEGAKDYRRGSSRRDSRDGSRSSDEEKDAGRGRDKYGDRKGERKNGRDRSSDRDGGVERSRHQQRSRDRKT